MNPTGSPRRKINTNKAATAQGVAGTTQLELPASALAPAAVSAAPAPESAAQDARMRRLHQQEIALYMGLLSILFSILMMAGGTYAWYTASVSTAVTTIQAGTFTPTVNAASTFSANTPALSFVPVPEEGTEATEASAEPVVWTDQGTYTLSQPVIVSNDGDIDFQYQAYLCVKESYTDEEKAADNYADNLPANMELLKKMTFTVQVNDDDPITGINFENDAILYPIKDENGTVTGQRAMIPLLRAPRLLAKADLTDEEGPETWPIDAIQVSVQVHNLLATDNGLTLNDVSIVINATQNVDEAAAYLGATVVHSADDLRTAVSSGNTLIQLGQDIELGETPLTVASDITLDLSGYALTSSSDRVIEVTDGTLTLRNAQNMRCTGTPLVVAGGKVITNFAPAEICSAAAAANEEETEWTISAS